MTILAIDSSEVCFYCANTFFTGQDCVRAHSDFYNQWLLFHKDCWKKYTFCGLSVDFMPSGNERSLPS